MATVFVTSNYRPEYRKAGIKAWSAKKDGVMVFSYQPQYISPEVSLGVGDRINICMQPLDEPSLYYKVQQGIIRGLVYAKSRLYITLQFSEHVETALEDLEKEVKEINLEGFVVFEDEEDI